MHTQAPSVMSNDAQCHLLIYLLYVVLPFRRNPSSPFQAAHANVALASAMQSAGKVMAGVNQVSEHVQEPKQARRLLRCTLLSRQHVRMR